MDALLLALQNVCSQLLPIMGVACLIFGCVALKKLAELLEAITTTVKNLGPTIKLVDQSIEKVQAPLDTVVKMSHTIDDVTDKTIDTVKQAGTYLNENVANIKSFVSEKMSKEKTAEVVEEAVEAVEEVVSEAASNE